jgi:hypothetical protein
VVEEASVGKTNIGLSEAIAALRAELTKAIDAGADQRMRFSIEPIELAIQVGVTRDASGKIGWQVVELGGSYEKVTTQTLTLKLDPLWQQADGTYTKDFTIAGEASPGDTFGQQH